MTRKGTRPDPAFRALPWLPWLKSSRSIVGALGSDSWRPLPQGPGNRRESGCAEYGISSGRLYQERGDLDPGVIETQEDGEVDRGRDRPEQRPVDGPAYPRGDDLVGTDPDVVMGK